MMKKINILQAFLTNDGGLSSYMLNNYIHIDKNRFNFTFITSEEIFNDEAKYRKLGADFLYANKRYGYLVYLIQLSKIFKESTCDILHLNFSAANLPVMFLAKIFFKGKIIIHSHTAGVVDENIFKRNIKFLIHKFCKNAIPYVGDYFFACSDKAAEWMYPAVIVNTKRYIVCKNAVDINKFKFDKFKRINLRRKNNITDTCIVIGHVAGFVYQKNHIFVIEILKALQQITDNFKIF